MSISREGLIAEQRSRGILDGCTGIRTKHSCWNTVSVNEPVFELEGSILELNRLMLELGRRNVDNPDEYQAQIVKSIHEKSFLISEVQGDLYSNLRDNRLRRHLMNLLNQEMPHAIYRVRMMPDRLILSSYTRMFAIGEGDGTEIELLVHSPVQLRVDYPLAFRDKSDYAIVQWCASDNISPGQRSLIRITEFREGDDADRLVRRVESSFEDMVAGYLIKIQKKEPMRARNI